MFFNFSLLHIYRKNEKIFIRPDEFDYFSTILRDICQYIIEYLNI